MEMPDSMQLHIAPWSVMVALLGCSLSVVNAQPRAHSGPLRCGPTDVLLEIRTHKKDLPRLTPTPGKAMIYYRYVGSRLFGKTNLTKMFRWGLAINGEWAGAVAYNTFSVFEVGPGPLELCTRRFMPRLFGKKVQWFDAMVGNLVVAPGKVYVVDETPSDDGVGVVVGTEVDEQRLIDDIRKRKLTYNTWAQRQVK